MNRLTKRYKSGIVTLDADAFMETQEAIDREILNCYPAKKAIERLAEYEDAEENCLLLRLQCKVGDTVWYVDKMWGEIWKGKVISTTQNYYTRDVCLNWLEIEYDSSKVGRQVIKSRADFMLGKTVFLTREEAEKALKEREDNG